MNYHASPGAFIKKNSAESCKLSITKTNLQVGGFVLICIASSYYAKCYSHYNFIWCFHLSNFWLKSKRNGFWIDMILAVLKQEMIGFSLKVLKSRYKGHIFNLINILLFGSQWLNPCVKYQRLISHKIIKLSNIRDKHENCRFYYRLNTFDEL